MDANSEPTDIELAKYIAGESSTGDARAIEAQLAASPDLRARLAQLRLIIGDERPAGEWNADAMWSSFRAMTETKPAPIRSARKRTSRHLSAETPWITVGVAAAMLIAVAGGLQLNVFHRVAAPAAVEEASHYTTARGQYATVQLSDGSRVTLAPQSRLTIPAAFGNGPRDVILDGEAIFDVHHDAARPFSVHAHGARVEDIGTKFDVRAYATDASVTVAVAEGSVALGRDRRDSPATTRAEGLVLRRGELGSLDTADRAATARTVRVTAYLSWASGRLSFVSRPLPEVLTTIGRWYDLDIRVPDRALAERLVTAEFSTQSPTDMIEALATAVNASVERHGRVVTLTVR